MIILSLVVLILFMGMANASSDLDDHNDTLTVSNEIEIVDDNNENLDNGNADMLGASSQEKLGSEIEFSGTTVSELITQIRSAAAGDTIILTNDLTATSNEARFSKSITIDGNNHIIDANGNTVFYNYQNGLHVVFKNIKFINGKKTDYGVFRCFYPQYDFINCTFENSGPLRFLESANGQIINCTFKNCAGSYGGAINFQGGNNFTIKNCYFENCSASSGAIIYTGLSSSSTYCTNMVVDNCTFVNSKNLQFGAIGNNFYGNVSNCTFKNITAYSSVVEIHDGNVYNCTFMDNNQTSPGINGYGVLCIYNSNVTKCNFTNNRRLVLDLNTGNCNVSNCSFENNTGYDLYNYVSYANVSNCTFNSPSEYEIYNAHHMFLENNTVSKNILNDGMISSKTYMVALNNQTVIQARGYQRTLNGTIKDDVGNTIEVGPNIIGFYGNCDYTFKMTNQAGTQVYTYRVYSGNVAYQYNSDEGIFYSPGYTFNDVGAYTVTPSFKNANANQGFSDTDILTGVLLVQGDAGMSVTHNNTIYVGENATVKVTLNDAARGNITITVGDKNKTFVLSDTLHGTVEWNVTDLPEGTYKVIVNYTGDSVYAAQNYEGDLVVKNYDTILLVTPEHGTYHQVVNATATLYYAKGSTIVGMIDDDLTVIINNKQYNVRSGEKIQVTDDLAVNAYEVVGIYYGSDRYSRAYNNTNLYVTKATPIVEIEVLTEPSEDRLGVRVRVNDTATGFVALKINDEVIDILSLKSVDEYGYLTKFIENINAGNFNIEAEYLGDENYTNASNKTSFSNIRGTYTDLQRLIDANTNLDLTYDFIYTPAIDGDKFPNGVNITKTITINGNNHIISGNNTLAVFYVNGTGVHLDNITFINAKAESTVFWNNTLGYISNSTFKDNNVTYDIYNNQTMYFENNTLENFIYNAGVILSKTNIIVLNNQTITRTKDVNVNLNAIIKDDNNNTIITKTKLQFILLRNVKNIIH